MAKIKNESATHVENEMRFIRKFEKGVIGYSKHSGMTRVYFALKHEPSK